MSQVFNDYMDEWAKATMKQGWDFIEKNLIENCLASQSGVNPHPSGSPCHVYLGDGKLAYFGPGVDPEKVAGAKL
jgi:hypothetical protein